MLLPSWMSADDFYVLGAGLLAGLAVFAIGTSFYERDRGQMKRVKMLKARREELKSQMGRSRRRKKPEGGVNLMRQVVNRLQLLKSAQSKQVQTLLIEAGFRSKDAIVYYMFFTVVLPIVFGVLSIVLLGLPIWGAGALSKFKIVLPVALPYLGLKLPAIVCRRARKRRYTRLQRALADTLDLMTICAEAGLSLAMALDRVSRELGLAYPEMAEELALTAMELNFLPERNKALSNWADRVQMPEIRGIVSVLIQTEKYGTPIAQALRVLSAEFREARMLRAENKAAKLPAMMTVPMILFILPTLFIVIVSPAAIKIMSMK
ncbi:MAG: type II secretion system F family protein [Alphaproteobacteria bacterium]|nr:type II secretion system F family protein [Alphaproteobacteria bacterium]